MSNAADHHASARRGRPPTGRKVVVQLPIDPDDSDALRNYAERQGRTIADVGRDIFYGKIKWKEVRKALNATEGAES